MKFKDLTILLSAVGSPCSPGALACYRNNGERNVKIVGMDMAEDPSIQYMVDVFYKVPPATADNYCDIVLDICRREKVDANDDEPREWSEGGVGGISLGDLINK